MTQWRWDQGRLAYFQFDEIKLISKALASVDGLRLPRGDEADPLREVLQSFSTLPFLPNNYTVWRNYKRVFGAMMLATEVGGLLICTDVCKKLALDEIDSDIYFATYFQNFYLSSPVFTDYNPYEQAVFPAILILKILCSKYINRNNISVNMEKLILLIKNNNLDGTEKLSNYLNLSDNNNTFIADEEKRQMREFVIFISQAGFLKWNSPNLFLDVNSKEEAENLLIALQPNIKLRHNDPSQELLNLSQIYKDKSIEKLKTISTNYLDLEFSEGSKIRAMHIKTERSSRLKEFYFKNIINPHLCDMCVMDTKIRYPWANVVIELHHLLPLSSPLRVEKKSSSLKDIVGLCPSCHRATHKYYSKWFKDNNSKDFSNYNEAKEVYSQAKGSIVL
jgi:hypothetical protein